VSLSGNSPDEKQGAKETRRARRQERITKRAPGELDDGSEEEKQEEKENTNSDNKDASMGRDWRARRPRYSDSEEEEEEDEEAEDLTPGAFAFSDGNLVRQVRGHISRHDMETESFQRGSRRTITASSGGRGRSSESNIPPEMRQRRISRTSRSSFFGFFANHQNLEPAECHVSEEENDTIFLEYAMLVCGGFLLVAVAVGVAVIGISNNNNGVTMPPPPPLKEDADDASMAPLTRQDRLQSQLAYLSSDSNVLKVDSSPQFFALTWLVNNDTVDEREIQRIEARYALATLFFSTNGDEWKDDLHFLSPQLHECKWTTSSAADNISGQGVGCNADMEIISLVIGTYILYYFLFFCV
jgi:hypothetical protein